MSDAFAAMRDNRANAIKEMMDRVNSEKKSGDDRFWVPPKSQKDGSGNAIIRFLPAPAGEKFAFVKRFVHMWDLPGGKRKFRENCPTTIDANGEKHDCPICAANGELWKRVEAGETSLKKLASSRGRKVTLISNIYVISDPERRENEGKVFLYRYGDRIWQKIAAKMNPPFQGVKPVDPFDLWEGCDFRLAVRVKDGFPNYDLSEFDSSSKLGGFDDKKLREIYDRQHSLMQFIAPSEFKSWDALLESFEKAISSGGSGHSLASQNQSQETVSERIRHTEEKFHKHESTGGALASGNDDVGDLDVSGLDTDEELRKLLAG